MLFVRLGGLAPARPIRVITRRMLSILGERELRLHSESHVLRCTVNDLCNQRMSTYSNTYIIPVQYTCWGSVWS